MVRMCHTEKTGRRTVRADGVADKADNQIHLGIVVEVQEACVVHQVVDLIRYNVSMDDLGRRAQRRSDEKRGQER